MIITAKNYQRMSRNLELINGGRGEESSPAAFKQDICLTLLIKARKVEPRSLLTWHKAPLHQVHVGTIPFKRGPNAISLLLRRTKRFLCWSRQDLTIDLSRFRETSILVKISIIFLHLYISWFLGNFTARNKALLTQCKRKWPKLQTAVCAAALQSGCEDMEREWEN